MKQIYPTEEYKREFPRDFYSIGICKHCGGRMKIKKLVKFYLIAVNSAGYFKIKKSTAKTPFLASGSFFKGKK